MDILEKDFYGQGEAVYPIERINLAAEKAFEDGEHILCVNGEYIAETLILENSCTISIV